MTRRAWMGVVGTLLAVSVTVGVAIAAYHAGQHHAATTEVVSNGEVVRVVGGHWGGWGYGPGPGFFLFPALLLGVVLFALVARGGRHRGDGPWGRPGYGPWAGGPGPALDEWHRAAHAAPGPSSGSGLSTGTGAGPPDPPPSAPA